jgi:hypothetical protein
MRKTTTVLFLLFVFAAKHGGRQRADGRQSTEVFAQIRQEGMEIRRSCGRLHFLPTFTDPRLTGSPSLKAAGMGVGRDDQMGI